jgi:hypothetical protein
MPDGDLGTSMADMSTLFMTTRDLTVRAESLFSSYCDKLHRSTMWC